MQEILEHVRRHRVNIDGDVCTVMVTTLVLEVGQYKSVLCDILAVVCSLFSS